MFKIVGSFIEPESNVNLQPKEKQSHRKENTAAKKYEHKNKVHKDFKLPRG